MSADELPCNIVAYYTTRPLMRFLKLPLYWKGIYLPHIPLLPFAAAWLAVGLVAILIFGGFFIIIGKDYEFRRLWFP